MSSCKVYVGNLAWATDENALGSHFANVGRVKEAVVMRSDGRSRGFGFVTFTAPEEAERAIARMNDTEIHGRRIRVNVANQQVRSGAMSAGDSYITPSTNQGYGPAAGGYPDGGHPYPVGAYGGYPPQHPSHPGSGFMYGMNPSMSYTGGVAPGYDGGPHSTGGPGQQKEGPAGGFYPPSGSYGYPPSGYGQPPY